MAHRGTNLLHPDTDRDFGAALKEHSRRRGTEFAPALWQRIATAPKDGREILVWVRWRNAPASEAIVRFDNREWLRSGNGRPIAKEALVFWMPLPGELTPSTAHD